MKIVTQNLSQTISRQNSFINFKKLFCFSYKTFLEKNLFLFNSISFQFLMLFQQLKLCFLTKIKFKYDYLEYKNFEIKKYLEFENFFLEENFCLNFCNQI